MIEDEIDGPGLKVASARFVSWLSFAVNAVLWFVVGYAYIVTKIRLQSLWPGQAIPLFYSVMLQLTMQFGLAWSPRFLGRPIVDHLLRRRGLVRPPAPKPGATVLWAAGDAVPARTTTVETWSRGTAVAMAIDAVESVEPVEVPFTLDGYILSGLAIWGLAAIGTPLVVMALLPGPDSSSFFLIWFGGLFASLATLLGVWVAVAAGGLVEPTRVDAEGVWGYPSRFATRRRFTPWSAVAACRVETDRDARGRVLDVRPTLIGPGGEPLMQLQMPEAMVADRERLVRALLFRLPKGAETGGLA